MKKTLIAAGVSLALASGGANALTGLQIDPTGMGSIAGSEFLTGLGSSFGNVLFENAFDTFGYNTATGGTTIWGHNSALLSFGEISWTFTFGATSAPGNILTPTTPGSSLSISQSPVAPSGRFDLYFDDTPDALQGPGTGYANGAHIASGTIRLIEPMTFTNASGTPTTVLSPNVPVASITGGGPMILQVDLGDPITGPGAAGTNFQDDNYILNGLTSVVLDMQTAWVTSLSDPAFSPFAFTTASGNLASTSFTADAGTATTSPFYGMTTPPVGPGVIGANDFTCEGGGVLSLQTCDLQAQSNTTFTFFQTQIPEPGTLALLGASLGLFGAGLRRRRSAEA